MSRTWSDHLELCFTIVTSESLGPVKTGWGFQDDPNDDRIVSPHIRHTLTLSPHNSWSRFLCCYYYHCIQQSSVHSNQNILQFNANNFISIMKCIFNKISRMAGREKSNLLIPAWQPFNLCLNWVPKKFYHASIGPTWASSNITAIIGQ